MSFNSYSVPYLLKGYYSKKVAYFSMEFATHQYIENIVVDWVSGRITFAQRMNCGKTWSVSVFCGSRIL